MITIIMNHKSLWFLSPWKQFDMTNNLITEINVCSTAAVKMILVPNTFVSLI